MANLFADFGPARLARVEHRIAARSQVFDQETCLRRFTTTFGTFKGDEERQSYSLAECIALFFGNLILQHSATFGNWAQLTQLTLCVTIRPEGKTMATPNPIIGQQLREAQTELARLRVEKLRIFPPNPHPLAQPDRFPRDATPDQIRQRNQLVAHIETLEQRIEELEAKLYTR